MKIRIALCMVFGLCCSYLLLNTDIKKPKMKVSDWVDVDDMNLKRFYTDRPKTYVLSFMGSGNTWMRYSLEYLTKRPTLEMRVHQITKINCPLGYWFDLGTDYDKDPIWKVHHIDYMKAMGTFDPLKETLIVIVRNYKEVLPRMRNILSIRETGRELHDQRAEDVVNSTLALQYLEILRLYDSWSPERRHMIYYEDLISDPEKIYKDLLAFLNEPPIYLDAFIALYSEHKKACLTIYAQQEDEPVTQGNKKIHYANMMQKEERIKLDQYIAQAVPHLWEKYLKNAYEESC